MTTFLRFSAASLDDGKVLMTCRVILRKREWLFNLLEKCPGPKAVPRSVGDVSSKATQGDLAMNQKGQIVENPPGSWKMSVPSVLIDHPKESTMVLANAERSIDGAARTAVWLEKACKANGDSLICETVLAGVLRLGPGSALDKEKVRVTGKRSNEAFLKSQDALQKEAKKPRVVHIS
eukprot:TRINITY_DN33357_c0_g1_i1.p1 TRINITY_DN33357_c0_g1~~TRINITY_DN33357_c0_g1_i1.p1  ORF type:complete len:178 (-),score=39.55 TRINITY_DN33357_c0_g1_i1:209-742(-)